MFNKASALFKLKIKVPQKQFKDLGGVNNLIKSIRTNDLTKHLNIYILGCQFIEVDEVVIDLIISSKNDKWVWGYES